MNNKIIKIKKLGVAYKNFHLKNISFNINEGINVLIGPNGSGKTTIIKSIIGGIANLGDEANINIEPSTKIAYIPEKNYFSKNTKVRKFLKLWFEFYNPKKTFQISSITETYPEIDVTSLLDKQMGQLSSGQLRRVLIFKSLLNNPNLIIMDEPFINLDPDNIINFFETIKKMQKNNITILIATHMLAEIEKYIDFVHILFFGKLVYTNKYMPKQDGSLYDLYQKYTKTQEVNQKEAKNEKPNSIPLKI